MTAEHNKRIAEIQARLADGPLAKWDSRERCEFEKCAPADIQYLLFRTRSDLDGSALADKDQLAVALNGLLGFVFSKADAHGFHVAYEPDYERARNVLAKLKRDGYTLPEDTG